MAYIGPEPNPGQNREVDDISSSFNGSTTAFTLQVNSQNVSPGSSNNIIVSLGGVVQNPTTDYTINSSTITFSTAPASGLSFFGLVLGQGVDAVEPADGSVSTIKIADQAVTLAKLPHGTGSNDGKFLRANNGADPTFETVTGTTINNNANNRLITGSGTANTLEGESEITFDGNSLVLANSTGTIKTERHGGGANFTLHGSADSGNTATGNNDDIGNIVWQTADGTDRNNVVAYMTARGAGAFSNSSHPTQLEFWTTADSSTTTTKRVIITKSGHLIPAANNTYDLGDSSTTWRNIYTNDLHLSNEGSQNDVDSTWGSYTIQEGFNDLFLINNRTGKKYKFNLTEVN